VVDVAGPDPLADDDPLVLDPPVLEVQARSDRPHLAPHRVLEHFFDPRWGDDLGVVVEEEQHIAVGRPGCGVHHPGVIEGMVVAHHPPRKTGQVRERRAVGCLVVDYDDLVIVIGRLLRDAAHTRFQEVETVPRRDNDGYPGPTEQPVLRPVGPGDDPVPDRYGMSPSIGRLAQGALRGQCGVRLGVDVRGGRPRDDPPGVERFGNVGDPVGVFHDAQDQVVILAAVETGPKAAELIHQRPADHCQVGDVVARHDHVG
jgi:hypothetical protein